jgi:hypothetical protein
MFGLYQPEHGPGSGVAYFSVKKKKTPLEDQLTGARETLATNLRRAMAEKFKHEPNRPLALAAKCPVGISVIKRLLLPGHPKYSYPKLDTLVQLAHGLGIDVYALVIDAQGQRNLSERDSKVADLVTDSRDLKRI